MGEYTGRRRGRAAPEPSAQEPGYPYVEESTYQQGYFAEPQYGYEQPAPEYQGYEEQQQYGYEYAPEYPQDPAYGYQNAPSYEQYPSYEQHPGYEQHPSYEQHPGYEQYPSYEQPANYAGDPSYETAYEPNAYYPQQGYVEEYPAEYNEGYHQGYQQESYYEQPYAEDYSDGYSDPYVDRYPEAYDPHDAYGSHNSYGSHDSYASNNSYDSYDSNASYESPERFRTPLPPLSHLPYTAAATAALAVAAFVSTKAVAAVVLPLQLVVAWAILDLAGHASRRTAVMAALPALAGTVATFKFQPDDAVLPVAAGLGAGFVLVAADAVFRARRHGVEPGSVRSLAAAASALLFAGLTGLFLPAAALQGTSVAVGAAVCGVVSLLAARNPELGASRTAVVAIPVTIAALASYAAAILVP